MDRSLLDGAVKHFIDCSIAPSTRTAYKSAQCRYTGFCSTYGVIAPYLLLEETLCSYVAYLAEERLKHRTSKAYLSGIRYHQIQQSLGDPFAGDGLPRLHYVLAGIKRVEGQTSLVRLPITVDIMRQLRAVWLYPPVGRDKIMLWVAACTVFWGFLRAGEFTVPTPQAGPPKPQ